MRCTSCNKFVPFNTEAEPELEGDLDFSIQSVSKPNNGKVQVELEVVGTVCMVNCCEECGQEMAEVNLDLQDIVIVQVSVDALDKDPEDLDESDFEIDEDGCSRDDCIEGKGRGAKHFYQAMVDFTVTGPGGATVSAQLAAEARGSEFEDIQ